MRLICPNCDAQYEVDDSAIPQTGRDVQCSNCGHTWFQMHPVMIAELEIAAALEAEPVAENIPPGETAPHADLWPTPDTVDAAAPLPPEAVSEPPEPEPADLAAHAPTTGRPTTDGPTPAWPADPKPEMPAAPETDPEPIAAPVVAAVADWDDLIEDLETGPATGFTLAPVAEPAAVAAAIRVKPRSLDDAVLGVLREEAERERRARQAETSALETQSELGLVPPPRSVAPARVVAPVVAPVVATATELADTLPSPDPLTDRIARMQLDDAAQPSAPVIEPPRSPYADTARPDANGRASRRDLLPDIEEINSTLRATSDKSRGMASSELLAVSPAPSSGRGFRSGFALILSLAALVMMIYATAPMISAKLPAIAPAMAAYVGAIDAGRLWLDGVMKKSLEKLKPTDAG